MEVKFVTSAPDLAGRPEPVLPEFAFIGRSNCGKSSLINHFLERSGIAKTSGKPGKTRLLNYFLVQDRYYLVDLPGYGFARVSKRQRAQWRGLFQRFLKAQDRPLALFHLLDVRHPPTKEDQEVSGWIRASGHPWAVAVTKIDKSHWDDKGIAVVHYQADGRRGAITIDDYKYKGGQAVLKLIEQHTGSESGESGAPSEDPPAKSDAPA